MTGTALDHVLAFLIPFFLKGAAGDQALAGQAATQLLEAHGAVTDWDILLAAEIIAFSFTTLDNLGKSMTDPDMPISTCLRLRSNANALSRRAERSRQSMQHGRHETRQPVQPAAEPAAPATAMQKVRDAIVEAAPSLAETLTTISQTMSRQQRRYLMRKTEQARAAQEREARKTARFASRATAMARDQRLIDADRVGSCPTPGTMKITTA
jgi:hypothetical protein